MMLNFKKIFFNLSLLSIVSIIALILPENVFAGYDCPGSSSPPSSGIYVRYCTDGDNNGTDAGRLLKVIVAPGPRVYPGDVMKFYAKIFDYNESCNTNSCLKDALSSVDIINNLGTSLYNVGNGSTVTFKLFDPNGTQYNQGSSGASGTWTSHATTSQSITNSTSEPRYTFSGTNYGTWWLYAQDDTTHDYTWYPLDYQSDLDTTPTDLFGYTVPKWISDYYNDNVSFLQSLQITDGPSKGLFHDSRNEPRITDLGSTAGPVKQYVAYEDAMQTGFAMKAMYDLWKMTGDSRLTTMMQYTIDNVYMKYQGDFNGGNTDPKLSVGSDGNWTQGNYNDDKVVYAYTKAYTDPPYANSQIWVPGKGTWAATGWADLGSSNDTNGDQDLGQLLGIYYSWLYLKQTNPSSPDITTLQNIVKAGSDLTGGKSSGWTEWSGSTAANRANGLLYVILNKMVGTSDFLIGNNKIWDKYLSNSTSQGYGETLTQELSLNPTSGDISFDDDAHHIFYQGIAMELYGQTSATISNSYTIGDLRNAIEQQVINISRDTQPDSTYFSKADVPYRLLHYNSGVDKFYLNSSTADGTIASGYTALDPWGEQFYAHDNADSASVTDYNYNAMYGIAKRSSYDQDYNFLPISSYSYEGLFSGASAMINPIMTQYRLRFSVDELLQLDYYLKYHKVSTTKPDIDPTNTSLDLLDKDWAYGTGNLSFKTWENGNVALSTQDERSGYIFKVSDNGSSNNTTITVNTSGTPTFAATQNDAYTVSTDNNLSVIPSSGSVDVNVSNWDNTGRTWTESSSTHSNNTSNTLQGLQPFTVYQITVDGSPYTTATTDGSGNINFNYTGTFSTHTFNVVSVGSVIDTSLSQAGAPGCLNTTPASAPNLFEIDPSSGNAKIYFTASLGPADRYFISYGTASDALGNGFEYPTTNKGINNLTIKSLKPNTLYYFKVRAGNGCQPGSWSNILSFNTNSSSPSYEYKTQVVNPIFFEKPQAVSNSNPVVAPSPTPEPQTTQLFISPQQVNLTVTLQKENTSGPVIDTLKSLFGKL